MSSSNKQRSHIIKEHLQYEIKDCVSFSLETAGHTRTLLDRCCKRRPLLLPYIILQLQTFALSITISIFSFSYQKYKQHSHYSFSITLLAILLLLFR
ncbi:hypothetical protein QVD17_10667 [Tagetes erecta]|uniref:Uncharacterized protein n=1 Tax=Tagetes erecta TaxID=13708 RepID=A0AAD8L6S6_TARER|nr:hypothetical protein QVD17_10667 [Tagetes erecta]